VFYGLFLSQQCHSYSAALHQPVIGIHQRGSTDLVFICLHLRKIENQACIQLRMRPVTTHVSHMMIYLPGDGHIKRMLVIAGFGY
jgi:hypothetical protein